MSWGAAWSLALGAYLFGWVVGSVLTRARASDPHRVRRMMQRQFDGMLADPLAPADLKRYARRVLDALDDRPQGD